MQKKTIMKKNLGISDRMVRFVVFNLLFGLPLAGVVMPDWLQHITFLLSLYMLITLIIGYSPLYHIVGWNTRKVDEKNVN